ncbi:MAG: hypothetical protein ACHQ52_05430 [Candidatus Eisenbacteria bacterium]
MEDIRGTTATLVVIFGLLLGGLPVAAPAATTTAPVTEAHAAQAPARVLPFIEDDYTRAVAEAKTRQVPLFIESWAPW